MVFRKIIFIAGGLLLFCLYLAASDDADPHPFAGSSACFVECHKAQKIQVTVTDPYNACSYMCLECHKDMDRHHAVNVRLKGKVSGELVLTSKKRLACITCHRPGNRRFDNISWKAESLYENIFSSKKKHKTYYLVTRNNDGQLCKMCH